MNQKFAVADKSNGIFTEAFATEEEAQAERLSVCEGIASEMVGLDYELKEDVNWDDIWGGEHRIIDGVGEPIILTHTYETALRDCLAFHMVVEIEEEE